MNETEGDKKGMAAKTIPSQTAHSIMTPDTLGAVPILVSWSIRNGAYQVAKVRWGETVSKSDAQKEAPVSG